MIPALTVSPEVRTLVPGFTHLVVEAHGLADGPSGGASVWCDDEGVTCRRRNWRQGVRTRITVRAPA